MPGGGGGGHCLFEGRCPKQNSSLIALAGLQPPVFKVSKESLWLLLLFAPGLPPVDIIFSCPDTITLITVAKTLIIANPGCFPWTSQAN